MLDRSDPCADRSFRAFGAVRVGGDVRAVVGRDLDGGPDLLLRELGVARLRPGGQHGTRRDDLQQVGATGEHPSGGPPHLVDRVRDADPQVGRQCHVGRETGDLPAAARARDVRPGTAHPWTLDDPGVDGVAQRDVDEGPERPDVADGRDAGPQGRRRVRDPHQGFVRGGPLQDSRRLARFDRADEMGVQVDQARKHRVRRQVDDLSVRRDRCPPRQDGHHPLALDEDHLVVAHLAGHDVDQPSRAYDESHAARA